VNNAAIDYETAVVDADLDRIRGVFEVNIVSLFVSAREVIKRMSTERGGAGGVIMNISSRSATSGGLPGDVVCSATKGAVDAFTLGLAKELGSHGIRVAGVRPGITRTEIFNSNIGIERAEELARHGTVLQRICEPDEVANLVTWMCTAEASYVSSVIYDIHGGSDTA
jgi:NAD(P)-dependent dehydrogenase (short-subunit alcohol dehydrogenase family)